jgi:regulatory protein
MDLDGVVARMAELHYVDDEAFASARAGALQRRGFGPMRVRAALRSAGIDAETSTALSDVPQEDAFAAARALAERRGFGSDPDRRDRQMAALVRAGHSFAAARAALDGIASETNLAPH